MLSQRTIAELIKAAEQAYSHRDLDLVFMRLEVADAPGVAQAPNRNKIRRLGSAVEALSQPGDDRTIQLARELLEVEMEGRIEGRGYLEPYLRRLIDALRVDGFDLLGGRLVATTPAPAALGPETTILEEELKASGFHVAANHYRQAVESFVDGRQEASNGQLRSALESLLMEVAKRVVGDALGGPRAAADRLRNAGFLDGDETKMIQGLVGVSNTNGAHPGLSNEEESLFRLHFTTATIRYLLSRLYAHNST